MRDIPDNPTMLKSSREQYDHLNEHHRLTRRSLKQKKGKGIYMRDVSQKHQATVCIR
jgi:hypothetical protein